MYFKLGQLCIWPHRDVIINNLPKDLRHDYRTTFRIINGTEIRTQATCAQGYIKDGDSIMTDKRFTIREELSK